MVCMLCGMGRGEGRKEEGVGGGWGIDRRGWRRGGQGRERCFEVSFIKEVDR